MRRSVSGEAWFRNCLRACVQVVTPSPGGPADKGGIKPGDAILAIDGRPIEDVTLYEVGSLLQGPQDSQVRLLLLDRCNCKQ